MCKQLCGKRKVRSVGADDSVIERCTNIAMPTNPFFAENHNARAVLKPHPADVMGIWPVSTRVNFPKNNGPEPIAAAR
jgi:putative SOS response-associated peptidase YedK